MDTVIEQINHKSIKNFLEAIGLERLPDHLESVIDYTGNLKVLLTSPTFGKDRKAYGIFIDGGMAGYAIVYEPEKHLDILYIAPEYRGMHFGEDLVRGCGARKVVVNRANQAAINLYEKVGLVIEFDDD